MHHDIKEITNVSTTMWRFPPTDLLTRIVATFITAASGFDTRTVDSARDWIGCTYLLFSFQAGKHEIDAAPGSIMSPPAIVIVDAVMIRIVLGQFIRLTTGADDSIDRIDDHTHIQLNRTPGSFALQLQERFYQLPFLIGHVTGARARIVRLCKPPAWLNRCVWNHSYSTRQEYSNGLRLTSLHGDNSSSDIRWSHCANLQPFY